MRSGVKYQAVAARGESKSQSSKLFVLPLVIVIAVAAGCGVLQSGITVPGSQIAVAFPSQSAEVGMPFTAVPSIRGGTPPYSFSLESGSTPPGTILNVQTGSVSGVPTVAGNFGFTLSVTDATSKEHGRGTSSIRVVSRTILGSHPQITISPSGATVVAKGSEQFSAAISGTSDTAVTWSATAGTISSTGKFTAPVVSNNTTVIVTATGATNSYAKASVNVTVTPIPSLAITTSALAGTARGTQYSDSLSASGGVSPYKWSVSAGALPTGIQLGSGGTISGTTVATGSFPFTAKVADSAGNTATHPYTLTVSSLSSKGFDGPAELPRVSISTAMANTPAPGHTITVNAGGNLQSALNSASCGDTILLQAGATFSGQFTFPSKSCDDGHWIVIRTSSDDSLLPSEGTRLTPCYAGVSSLPGRPALNCASTKNVLAKLVMNRVGSGPVLFAAGANHYRLIGLELTRTPGIGVVYGLASGMSGASYSNIIYDRLWMHGTAQDETVRGIFLGNSGYVSVVDSSFTDFHCIAISGSCGDAQAIAGGIGTAPMGPYKISNNFLEASGENILFGGGGATATPTDIEITHNHMFKPLTWMKGQPGYVGGADGNAFIVKNLFELKNAQRVLFDGNLLENTWGGFSQAGFAILLTPKNPGGTSPCPVCQVTDVTIRYSSISHVAAGLQIANALSDYGAAALDGQRYSIHDVVIDDIDGTKYNGPGEFAQVSVNSGAPLLQNVTINHITAFPPKTLFIIGDQVASSTKMKNFVFTNSIVTAGLYPVWSTGGGTVNCAYYDKPLTTFNACFSPYSFAKNVVIAAPTSFPASVWPTGNYFASSVTQVEFAGVTARNYQLLSSSPYVNSGTDGKPLGADMTAIESAISGVN
jgi:hypothetical protein